MKNKYFRYIERFTGKKILVIGDLILDKFLYGTVSRISPEAPVPVVDITKEAFMPGGAGNVSNNISSLGAKALITGVIGEDTSGKRLINKLEEFNINTDGIFIDSSRPTTIKTRIIANHQQIVRYDRESREKLSHNTLSRMTAYLQNVADKVDAIMISDYGKGVITSELLKNVIRLANGKGIPVTVDPKIEHFINYKRITTMTPNLNEAIQGMRLHTKVTTEQEIKELGQKILKTLGSKSVIITLGERGMAIFEKSKAPVFIPTRAKEVFDVTGAGDTVIAVLTLCLASGAPLKIAAEIANYAAGVVVGKLGTATVSAEELKKAI